MAKRTFDLLVSLAACLALSPLLAAVAIVLRLTGEGEIFFRQQRIGRDGKPFAILKFATMLKNSPNLAGGDITMDRDPRILPIGRFLRKTKINELPQLLNVVAGDMSLIGPRPLTPRVAALFPEGHWEKMKSVRPGLSGLGSIVFRNEEEILAGANDRAALYRDLIAPYKASLEQWYAQRRSFGLDLKLIALTLAVVFDKTLNARSYFPDLPPPPQALQSLLDRR